MCRWLIIALLLSQAGAVCSQNLSSVTCSIDKSEKNQLLEKTLQAKNEIHAAQVKLFKTYLHIDSAAALNRSNSQMRTDILLALSDLKDIEKSLGSAAVKAQYSVYWIQNCFK